MARKPKTEAFAIDLGTTNTKIGRWDFALDRPVLIDLARIARERSVDDALEVPRMVPSATHAIHQLDATGRIERWPGVARFET